MAYGSWLMAHGSWLMAHGSWLIAPAFATANFRRYSVLGPRYSVLGTGSSVLGLRASVSNNNPHQIMHSCTAERGVWNSYGASGNGGL